MRNTFQENKYKNMNMFNLYVILYMLAKLCAEVQDWVRQNFKETTLQSGCVYTQ